MEDGTRLTRRSVCDALGALVAPNQDVDLLVLFGSVARGEDHRRSDIDLLLDGPAAHDEWAMALLLGALIEAFDQPVELLTLSEAKSLAPVFAGVIRDGIVIQDRLDQWGALLTMRDRIELDASAEASTYPSRRTAALARLTDGMRM
jgi:predicted nucleotidyltransferase